MSVNIIDAFQSIAHYRHNELMQQRRKYTGAPYSDHTDEVSCLYQEFFPGEVIGAAAAHGHDLLEDTKATVIELLVAASKIVDQHEQTLIPEVIVTIVGLTDVYTPEMYQLQGRDWRKAQEAIRLGGETERVQNIKVCDLLDNTRDIVQNDPDFAVTYLREKIAVLHRLTKADKRLRVRAMSQILMAQQKLGLIPQAIVI